MRPRRGASRGAAVLLLATLGLVACGSGDEEAGAGPAPTLAGQVFDDPAGDVEPRWTYGRPPPRDGVGDVRRAAIEVQGGRLVLTVALAGVAEESPAGRRATRFDVRFGGLFSSARSTFDELRIGGSANDRGVASASVSVFNEVQETNLDLCRGSAGYSPSRALIRIQVPLSCLPGDRLSVGGPTLEVTTSGPRGAGTDTVDLGVRRLTAP